MTSLLAAETDLSMFARAVAGRWFGVRSAAEYDGPGSPVDPRFPLHDRSTLYLPESLDLPDGDKGHRRYRLMALVQLAYTEFRTYAFEIAEARSRSSLLAARPEVGARTRSDFEAFYQHFPSPDTARILFATLEPARLEAALIRVYPGVAADLLAARASELAVRPALPAAGLDRILEALVLHTLGGEPEGDPGILLVDVVERLRRPEADVYDTADAVAVLYERLESAGADPIAEGEPPLVSFRGRPPIEWLQREDRVERWGWELAALEELQRESANDMPGSAYIPDALADGDTVDMGAKDSQGPGARTFAENRAFLAKAIEDERSALIRLAGIDEPLDAPSYRYPEWDFVAHAYLPDHCRVYELRPEPAVDEDVSDLLASIGPHRTDVRKMFERIRPSSLRTVGGLIDGDEIDVDALIGFQVERRRGAGPEPRIYRKRHVMARDVSVALLLDLSASTGDPVDEEPAREEPDVDRSRQTYEEWMAELGAPFPVRRTVIDVMRESFLLMALALDSLGDRFGLYGFSGHGKERVEYYTIKDLHETFTPATIRALAGVRPHKATRMGPAVRHAVRKLSRSGSNLQVLIIVSDGYPQDVDYGSDRSDRQYGIEDTARALEEARLAGIETFCVTVDRSGQDYLRAMAPDNRYLVIEEIEDLPSELAKVYETLTAG